MLILAKHSNEKIQEIKVLHNEFEKAIEVINEQDIYEERKGACLDGLTNIHSKPVDEV